MVYDEPVRVKRNKEDYDTNLWDPSGNNCITKLGLAKNGDDDDIDYCTWVTFASTNKKEVEIFMRGVRSAWSLLPRVG